MSGADDLTTRAGADDLPRLLELVAQFCAADGHRFDVDRVAGALAPLLTGDDVGQVWLVHEPTAGAASAGGPAGSGGPAGPGGATVVPSVVGYVVVTWGWSLESGGRECLVDELYLRPVARGRGVGGAALEHALAAARTHGARVAFLETEPANEAARRLYRRHGFTDEDSRWLRRPLA